MAGPVAKGTTLDRYVVERILGEGGMATVYGVRHRDLGTLYALKLLKLRVRTLADRLLQEGRIQAALRHPNVVAVTDVLRLDDDIGLVMEFVDGLPLDLLLVNHQLSADEIDALALDLFDGIEAAHDLDLVHRDLKPANVMLAAQRDRMQAKITDFGLAKAVTEELSVGRATRTGAVMGTPTFMAPEQHQDAKSVDGRADLFSLGLILYEAITGTPAIPHDAMPDILRHVMQEDYRPIAELAPEAPERWTRAVMACLHSDRDERPDDVAAVRALWAAPGRPVRWSEATMNALRHIQANAPAAPELPSLEPDRETLVAPSSVPNGPPPEVAAPLPSPTPLSRLGLVAGTAALTTGVAAAGALAVALGVGVWFLWPLPSPQVPNRVAEAPAPPPSPDPVPSAVAPVPQPSPAAIPPPPPPPVAKPAPPASQPPEPAHRPRPEPARPPEPVTPIPAPAPVQAPAPAAAPSVTLDGDWRAYLQGDGQRHDLATAPTGTYELWVLFDLQRPTKVGELEVVEGRTLSVRCDELSTACRW